MITTETINELSYGKGAEGMTAMSLQEALKVAEQCCQELPPTNPNVLVRALYTIRCAQMETAHETKQVNDILRCAEQVIATWWVSTMGFSEGIAAHGEAMDRLKEVAS